MPSPGSSVAVCTVAALLAWHRHFGFRHTSSDAVTWQSAELLRRESLDLMVLQHSCDLAMWQHILTWQ